MKRLHFLVLVLLIFPSLLKAQQTYYGALEYKIPKLTSLPPLYSGQPSDVATAYLWLDNAMRSTTKNAVRTLIDSLQWGDSTKFLASRLYRMVDDNPVAFLQWSLRGDVPPYNFDLSYARLRLQNRIGTVASDNGVTGFLLAADIIADIMVQDTTCVKDPIAMIAKDAVKVDAIILDPIKGRQVPSCQALSYKEHKSGAPRPQSVAISTSAGPADSGSCLQFEYSPEWSRMEGDDAGAAPLKDPSGGWWVKPNKEYIVFLYFPGIWADSSNHYFSAYPFGGDFGNQGGMYQVINGAVVDPKDDLGLGAPNLPLSDWKARLRGKIQEIVSH